VHAQPLNPGDGAVVPHVWGGSKRTRVAGKAVPRMALCAWRVDEAPLDEFVDRLP
jgi:hypothetical protein